MTDPRSFGAWLHRERERRGVSLRAIADRSKIGMSVLEALERGDVSRWPGGIYRRAFVRAYCTAVGLDADLVVANFEKVFPPADAEGAPTTQATSGPSSPVDQSEMRLQLAGPPAPFVPVQAMRTACLDVAFVLVMGAIGWVGAGAIGFWCAAAVAAVVYHVCGVLGVRGAVDRRIASGERAPEARPLATVVSFSEETRSMSRRARARRMVADLSAAAIPLASSRRRRAVRS